MQHRAVVTACPAGMDSSRKEQTHLLPSLPRRRPRSSFDRHQASAFVLRLRPSHLRYITTRHSVAWSSPLQARRLARQLDPYLVRRHHHHHHPRRRRSRSSSSTRVLSKFGQQTSRATLTAAASTAAGAAAAATGPGAAAALAAAAPAGKGGKQRKISCITLPLHHNSLGRVKATLHPPSKAEEQCASKQERPSPLLSLFKLPSPPVRLAFL